jgi:hypothetical protein
MLQTVRACYNRTCISIIYLRDCSLTRSVLAGPRNKFVFFGGACMRAGVTKDERLVLDIGYLNLKIPLYIYV